MALVKSADTPCPVPADFDGDSYHRVAAGAAAFSHRSAWSSYASGMNAVAYRFAAADESHERFVAAITASDALSPSGPRYLQEVSLFSFFVNALSTIECACFAIYNLGACVKPGAFPAGTREDLRDVNIKQTARFFKHDFHGQPISKTLLALRDSVELEALRTHRDFLAHRGVSPRRHDLGFVPWGSTVDVATAVRSASVPRNPKDVPANWKADVSLSANMTAEPRAWLATETNRLLRDAATFVESASLLAG